MKRIATLISAVLLFCFFGPISAPASAAPTMTQQNEPGQVALNGDGNFRGRNDLYQLVAPSVGNWDLVGAWNFNNTQDAGAATGSYATNNCASGNNNTGNWGPTSNSWDAIQFNAINNYGKGISSSLVNRAGVNTGISLSTSINSPNSSGCTTVFSFTDYYGGPYTNTFAQVRRTTETINGASYVYPESYFRVSEANNAVWENTFSNLNPNNKYRFQFVYSALNVLSERVTSKSSVAGATETVVTQDVSAAITSSRHKNRITVELTGADSYTLSRQNLNGTTAMVLNAFTIYQERKTSTSTSMSTSDATPSYGAAVTLSATVSPAATGTVMFYDALNTLLCTTSALSSGSGSCSWTPASPGAATVRAVYGGDASYASSTSTTTIITAGKAPSTTLITCASRSYSGSAQEPCTATATGAGGLSTAVSVTYENNTGAGTATATAQYAGDATHDGSSATPVSFAISKALPTFSWNGITKKYGDATFVISPPTPNVSGTFTYSSNAPAVLSLSGSTATINSAGSSIITATFSPTDSDNYESGLITQMTVTVNKATVTITASSSTISYGSEAPIITPAFSALVGNDNANVISSTSCSSGSYSPTTTVGTFVATSCTGAVSDNYQFVYTAGIITITRASAANDLQVTSLAATYGTDLTLTASGGLGNGSLSYRVISGPCVISIDGTKLVTSSNGTCSVTVTKSASTNYEELTSSQFSVIVARKNLTIVGLSGVNKQYDGNRNSSLPTGVPSLFGLVGNDVVSLEGTPEFVFASSNASNGITVQGSGYSLTNTDAGKYTLSQPTVVADISRKAVTVTAANISVGQGQSFTSTVTASGLIAPDSISAATYRYSTGTGTPPTAAGTSSITPSVAVLSVGNTANYSFSYLPGTLEILGEYTITLNPSRGSVSPSSLNYQIGASALTLPLPTRANYRFEGWFDESVTPSRLVSNLSYQPVQDSTLVAHWTQLSLANLDNPTIFGTIRATSGLDAGMSATRLGTRVEIDYFADTLPDGTIINAYLQASTSNAAQILQGVDNLLLSVVVAWSAPDGTVPDISNANIAIRLKITNASIKAGAKIYSILGAQSQLLGTASADGWVVLEIRQDPEIIIANPATVQMQNTNLNDTPSLPLIGSGQTSEDLAKAAAELKAAAEKIAAEKLATELGLKEKLALEKLARDLAAKLAADAAAANSKLSNPKFAIYSIGSTLKLSSRDLAMLKKFANSMKAGSRVTCVGYIYPSSKSLAASKAQALAQAMAVCSMLSKAKPSIKTTTVLLSASKAPKAPVGAKWLVGSFRVDGF